MAQKGPCLLQGTQEDRMHYHATSLFETTKGRYKDIGAAADTASQEYPIRLRQPIQTTGHLTVNHINPIRTRPPDIALNQPDP